MKPRLALYTLLAASLTCGPVRAQCTSVSPTLMNGPVREYSGMYRNLSYGFSVVIPRGLSGLDAQNPDYQRGFTISFHNWRANLTVYSEANSLEYADARGAAVGDLDLWRQSNKAVLSSDLEPGELDGRPAETLRVRYRCPQNEAEYMWVETAALSADHGYVYTISWEGPSSEFDLDHVVIEQLKRSWKFLRPR